ncbi:recombinase RecB [Alkanindiges hydrocarboniclasticus]|jgi:single-strand DNA-binding protein|uniref:Single-stranded DNA-binding protein n=1 Tax=Alkanindiges hydrocarboniclasticus TaxID=1907941 RepID=A0A1S8CSD4_9GAMM|nr:single-stranded DNA-binding protein [Alkanindiges hydrocarboniclasticus]ONG38513.1 recombinase RecB [Alkanindiges hydrocarboniclasticus]
MRGVNKVILVGTLGRDPETKSFPNGGSLTQFSIATSESWTDKNTGERQEITEWHRIVLNNRLGEVAQQYLKKGSKVYIEGSLRTRKWTDKDGQERFTTEIRGDSMQMLDGPRGGQGEGSQNMDYAPYSARSGNGQSGNNYAGNNQSGDNQYSSGQSRNTAASSSPQYNTDLDDDLPF